MQKTHSLDRKLGSRHWCFKYESEFNVTKFTAEQKFTFLAKEKNELKHVVITKEKDAADLKEKYEVYLGKAKFIIKMLDPNNNQLTNNEINSLRNNLNAKDKQIDELTVNDMPNKKTVA